MNEKEAYPCGMPHGPPTQTAVTAVTLMTLVTAVTTATTATTQLNSAWKEMNERLTRFFLPPTLIGAIE